MLCPSQVKAVVSRNLYVNICGSSAASDAIFEYCTPKENDDSGYRGDDYPEHATFLREDSSLNGEYPHSFDFNPCGSYIAIGNRTSSNVTIATRELRSHGALGKFMPRLMSNFQAPQPR